MRKETSLKLELMRQTVDYSEKRLRAYDSIVPARSRNLSKFIISLGEMRGLAEGVGDLKKVFYARGIVGEIQLAQQIILSQSKV